MMAMQRKGKEGRANGDSVHEEKPSELTERRSECIWLLMAGRVGMKCLISVMPHLPPIGQIILEGVGGTATL